MNELVEKYIGSDNVRVIIEAGACDCTDSIRLANQYPNAHVYTFECNPMQLPICRKAVEGNERITLTEKGLSDKEGDVTFYPINVHKTVTTHSNGNPGASSMFKASGKYPIEKYVQDETTVPVTTLDRFLDCNDIKYVDLMWLDAQGSELSILKGMGDRIANVKIIKTEVMFKDQYTGTPLFEDVKLFLESKGFIFVKLTDSYEWFGDALFVNKSL